MIINILTTVIILFVLYVVIEYIGQYIVSKNYVDMSRASKDWEISSTYQPDKKISESKWLSEFKVGTVHLHRQDKYFKGGNISA